MKRPVADASWEPEIHALYNHDYQEIWDPRINRHVWNQYHNQLRIYHRLVERHGQVPLRILDVGCAQATLAMQLAEKGHQVVAVDIRPNFLEYAQSRYSHGNIRFQAANVFDFEEVDSFDIIFANQIIEHMHRPERLIGHLRRSLKAGGQLVVSTPNWRYFKNRLPSYEELGDPDQFEHMQFTADADGHFFAFKAEELVAAFRQSGFECLQMAYFESPAISGHFKLRYLHAFVSEAILRAIDRAILATPLDASLAHQLMVCAIKE